jgi:hypothetical protein
MLVAAMIAVVGQTVVLSNDFGHGNDLQRGGNARMITAAAVSRAGAIQIPSESPAGSDAPARDRGAPPVRAA